MSKCVTALETGIEATSGSLIRTDSPISTVTVPEAHLVFNCPCGKEHRISLSDLPSSTARRLQIEEKCEYARHFIIHTGHSRYRKILIVSEFGD